MATIAEQETEVIEIRVPNPLHKLYTREEARRVLTRPVIKFFEVRPLFLDGIKTEIVAAVSTYEAWEKFSKMNSGHVTHNGERVELVRNYWVVKETKDIQFGYPLTDTGEELPSQMAAGTGCGGESPARTGEG